MQEIKFRGYNEVSKQFIFGLLLKWSDGTSKIVIEDQDQTFKTYLVNENSIGQYTGLKDKNGKEIYEGDIVEAWSQGDKHIGEIRWRLEGQPSIIIYPAYANQGFWKIHGSKNNNSEFIDSGIEVIGNIHENPELLK